MLKKRGKKYYAVFSTDRRERWINTEKTDRREAMKVHARLETVFQRERTARALTTALLDCVKALAHGEINRDTAKSMAVAIEAQAYNQALAVIDEFLPFPGVLAETVLEQYLQSEPELKASTKVTKLQRFRKFAAWWKDRDCRKLTDSDCRRFLDSLGTGKSQTVNNYISDLSSIWQASPELNNPWTEKLRRKNNVEHKSPFTREEISALIAYCSQTGNTFWRVAVILGYYTGMRLKDVIFFSRFDIRSDGYISIIPEKTARTGKRVSIPIFPKLREELDNLTPETGTGYYFPEMVKRYNESRNKVCKEFLRLLDSAGLHRSGLGFHSLRHTFVTLATDAGISTEDIQAAVGHSSVALTQNTYYHGVKSADLTGFPEL